MTTRALVLAGGGVRGAFQVGMVRELVKQLDFHIIRGVSVGAINGAFLAQAPSRPDSTAAMQRQAAALEQVWDELGRILGKIGKSETDRIARMQVFGTALKDLIHKTIDRKHLLASKRDFTAGYVSLLTGRYMEAGPRHADVLDLVRASAALPPHFPFVETKADLVVDGGFRNITPLASALKAKSAPDEIYVLLTRRIASRGGRLLSCTIEAQPLDPDWTSRRCDQRKLYEQVTERLVEILMDEVYIEDIKRAIQLNMLARTLHDSRAPEAIAERLLPSPGTERGARRRRPRHVKLYVLAPRRRFHPDAKPGHGDDIDNFDTELIRSAIDHGAKVAADPSKWAWHPGLEDEIAMLA